MDSPAIAKEMLRVYGDKCKIIKIDMLYEKEVQKYVMGIEEANRKAKNSTLVFKGGYDVIL